MRKTIVVLLAVLLCSCEGVHGEGKYRTLDWDTFVDKVDGGWLGQMIGVSFA